MENARNHAHKAVAQHAATYCGEEAHHDANDGRKAVDQRLVCAGCRIDADRDDVEQGDDDCREDVDDGCRGNGKRERHRLVEDVDVAHLQRHIAQKTAAQSADHSERDGAHQVELVLARNQHARDRCSDNSEHLEPKRNSDHGIRGV